jgi:hypothetical protein
VIDPDREALPIHIRSEMRDGPHDRQTLFFGSAVAIFRSGKAYTPVSQGFFPIRHDTEIASNQFSQKKRQCAKYTSLLSSVALKSEGSVNIPVGFQLISFASP